MRCESRQYIYTHHNSYCLQRRTTGEALGAKRVHRSLTLNSRSYNTETTAWRAYNPTKDIGFIVPKRLQDSDILAVFGSCVIEESVAGNEAQKRSERILLWPYEWHPTFYTDHASSVKSSIALKPSSPDLINASLPTRIDCIDVPYQRTVVHPHLPSGAAYAVKEGGNDGERQTMFGSEPSDIWSKGQNMMLYSKEVQTIPKSSPNMKHAAADSSSPTGSVEELTGLEYQSQDSRLFEQSNSRISKDVIAGIEPHNAQSCSHIRPLSVEESQQPAVDVCVFSPHSDEDSPQSDVLRPALGVIQTDRRERIITELESELFTRNIHIIGLGSVGQYVAHALASVPEPPPITLLMHLPLLMQQWHEEGEAITLVKNGQVHTRSGFHIEWSADFEMPAHQQFPRFGENLEHTPEPPNTFIGTLIVTTGALSIIPALLAIKPRLGRYSTICFVQDGLGIIEKVNADVFPDPSSRPTYVQGSLSSKLLATGKSFTVVEARSGTLFCSKMPRLSSSEQISEHTDASTLSINRADFSWDSQARYLVKMLTRSPVFRTETQGHKSFYKIHLRRVAVNAVIGPLSVLLDCSNDLLLNNFHSTHVMRLALREICQVIQSLPERHGMEGVDLFTGNRLESVAISLLRRTGKNITSMLQDVRAGRRSDIDFYTGYFVQRGKELGIHCPVCEMLVEVVKAKQWGIRQEGRRLIPFRDIQP